MDCIFISPDGKKEFKDIAGATIPAPKGEMGILPGHAEAFVRLKEGEVTIQNEDGKNKDTIQIAGGICHIRNSQILIIQDGKDSLS